EETDPAGSGEGLTLSVVHGDGQVALPGASLYDTLMVQLVDENEVPVAGRQIGFKTELSGTTLFTTEATTDKHGIARSRVAIGDLQPGTHQAVSAFLKSDADIRADFSVKIVAETEV